MTEFRARKAIRSSEYKLKWKVREKEKVPFKGGIYVAVSITDRTFFSFHVSDVMYEYSSTTGRWLKLPPCGFVGCALANVKGNLVTVGGYNSQRDEAISDCFSFDDDLRRWILCYPPMSTARLYPVVATTADYLTVVGGRVNKRETQDVEVMNVNTHQWSAVASLPMLQVSGFERIAITSAAVCGATVYVVVGLANQVCLHYCSLDALLKSTPEQTEVWGTVDGPHCSKVSLVTVNNHLLCLGKVAECNVIAVFIYEEKMDKVFQEFGVFPRNIEYFSAVATVAKNGFLVIATKLVLIGELLSILEGETVSIASLFASIATQLRTKCVQFRLITIISYAIVISCCMA